MNAGKSLVAQVMDFVPWKTFGHMGLRQRGESGVRTLSCTELFRIMAIDPLTWRESLRDNLVCLTGNQPKFFHMGMRHMLARPALADTLNSRNCHMDHALAMRFHATQAAVKMHALLKLRGATPAFTHIITLPALTIAALNKNRWQVEWFFKWIQQHLRIKRFLGTTKNAVKMKISSAVGTYVLIAMVKKGLQLKASLCTFQQIFWCRNSKKTRVHVLCSQMSRHLHHLNALGR